MTHLQLSFGQRISAVFFFDEGSTSVFKGSLMSLYAIAVCVIGLQKMKKEERERERNTLSAYTCMHVQDPCFETVALDIIEYFFTATEFFL